MIFFKNKGVWDEINLIINYFDFPLKNCYRSAFRSSRSQKNSHRILRNLICCMMWSGRSGKRQVPIKKKTFFEIKWIQFCIIFNSYYHLCVFHLFFIKMQSNFFSNLLKIKIFSRFIKVEIPWKHVLSFLHVVDFTITGLVVPIWICLLVWKKNYNFSKK